MSGITATAADPGLHQRWGITFERGISDNGSYVRAKSLHSRVRLYRHQAQVHQAIAALRISAGYGRQTSSGS